MSEDKIQSFEIYSPKFNFDLKGHTKIELRNPYRTQVFEDDNVIQTDVLNHQLDELGDYNMSVYKNTWSPLWKYLFGGIFLFDNTIPVGSKYMPQGVIMTANGSAGTTNTSAPLAMGSWDSVKSSINATQCKMVYNWTQQQGNGDIASVCLTSRVGGYIGYGNKDNAVKSTINITTDQDHNIILNSQQLNNIYMDENYITYIDFDNTNKTVTLTKNKKSINSIDLISRAADPEVVVLNYNTALDGNMSNAWWSDGGKKIVYSGTKTVNIGDTIQVLVIDMETETLSEFTITNNSDSNWIYTYNTSTDTSIRGFDGTHIYMSSNTASTNAKIYKVRLSDSQIVSTIDGVRTEGYTRNGVKLLTDNHRFVLDSSSRVCVIDEINNTKYPINTSNLICYRDYQGTQTLTHNKTLDIIQSIQSELTYGYIRWKVFKNPLYLATINNLDNVVTKTNEDSMIVTYTLEQAN